MDSNKPEYIAEKWSLRESSGTRSGITLQCLRADLESGKGSSIGEAKSSICCQEVRTNISSKSALRKIAIYASIVRFNKFIQDTN